jgi:TonB family protein
MKRSLFTFMFLYAVLMLVCNMGIAQSVNVLDEVDRAPKFSGKPSNTAKFFEKYMNYPNEARLKMIEGVVEISGIVTDDGKLVELAVEKSVDPLLDSEALRLVALMQDWKAAKRDGQAINTRISLAVSFRLSPDEKELMQTLKENGLTENMPLFVIDDKIVKEYIELPQYNVKSVRVMKGQKAIDRFGSDAKNGVVIITTKRGTPPVW